MYFVLMEDCEKGGLGWGMDSSIGFFRTREEAVEKIRETVQRSPRLLKFQLVHLRKSDTYPAGIDSLIAREYEADEKGNILSHKTLKTDTGSTLSWPITIEHCPPIPLE